MVLAQPSLRFLQHNRGEKRPLGLVRTTLCLLHPDVWEVLTKHSPQTLHAL